MKFISQILITTTFFFLGSQNAYSVMSEPQKDTSECKRLVQIFQKGHFSGQVRNFTMATLNQGLLHDYYANAAGATIHYQIHPFKGFSVGISGLFVYRIFSNDLTDTDHIVGRMSKFERQLFDLENTSNYDNMDRLEAFYLNYDFKMWNVVLGKMQMQSPMVHPHDGRMKPKVFSGIRINHETKKLKTTFSWFTKSSPRSVTHWYSIQDAIGLYDNGFLENGSDADYHHKIQSAGLGILGLEYDVAKNFKLTFWNYNLDNINNTSIGKVDYTKDSSFFAGIMYLYQTPLGNGGANQIEHRFYQINEETNAVSARVGYHFNLFDLETSFTKVFESGKYLFPREFGVDPFYTFIPRSQIEGYGDAFSTRISLVRKKGRFSSQMDWQTMMVKKDLKFNKYDIPSYQQFNLDMTYKFANMLEGLEVKFLYIYRVALEKEISDEQVFNNLNFHQFNLIANINF